MSRIEMFLMKRFNKWLRSKEPTLYVTGIYGYAYVKIGNYRFYFHNTDDRVVRKRTITTFGGKKKRQQIIPYDGWEKSLCKDNSCNTEVAKVER